MVVVYSLGFLCSLVVVTMAFLLIKNAFIPDWSGHVCISKLVAIACIDIILLCSCLLMYLMGLLILKYAAIL